jgi:hypothetical protein
MRFSSADLAMTMPPAIVGRKGRRVELENADRRARDPAGVARRAKHPKLCQAPFEKTF